MTVELGTEKTAGLRVHRKRNKLMSYRNLYTYYNIASNAAVRMCHSHQLGDLRYDRHGILPEYLSLTVSDGVMHRVEFGPKARAFTWNPPPMLGIWSLK